MNRDQFNDFLIRSIPMLKRYCMKLCDYHKEDSEDLVQTTLVRAMSGTLQYDDHPERWIIIIAKHEHINIKIRKALHASHNLELRSHFNSTTVQEHSCDYQYFENKLRSLSKRKGEIFLKYLEGYSYKELAEMEQLNLSKIKNRMYDARTEFATIVK